MRTGTKLASGLCALWLFACNDSAPADEPLELGGVPTFAVRLSDFSSAGVALLDGDGKVLSKKFVSSGSALPGLSQALPGDISLPTQPCVEGYLTTIGRTGGNFILQQDIETSGVVRQVKTQRKSSEGAFSSNPHDILCFDDGKALVTRYEPNLGKDVADIDRGDDVLLLDLDTGKGLRSISLAALQGTAKGADGKSVRIHARPASVVQVGHYAVVGVGRLSIDFLTAAPARLALIDLDDESVRGVDLPEGFRDCEFIVRAADRDDAVVVSCSGSPYGDRASVGVLLISIDDAGEVTVEASYRPKAKGPAPFSGVASLGGTRVYAVDDGDFTSQVPDQGYVVDLADGSLEQVVESAGAYELGDAECRADSGLLLVPDASKGVYLFKVSADSVKRTGLVELPAKLPARGVRSLLHFR